MYELLVAAVVDSLRSQSRFVEEAEIGEEEENRPAVQIVVLAAEKTLFVVTVVYSTLTLLRPI